MLTAAVYPKVVLNRDGHPVVSGLSGFDGLNLSIGAVKKIATDAGGSWDDETIRLVEQLVREGAIETTRVVVAYWLYLGQVGRNMEDNAGSKKSTALAEKVCRQRNLTSDDLSFCHLRAKHFMRRGPHQARGDGRVVRPPVEWTKKKPEASKQPKESRPRQTTGPERADKAKSGNSTGAGSSRPPPDSEGNAPSNMERRLFQATAYSNPFWSDPGGLSEDLKLVRAELKRRTAVLEKATAKSRQLNPVFEFSGLILLICVVLFFVGWFQAVEGGETPIWNIGIWGSVISFFVLVVTAFASNEPDRIVSAGLYYPCQKIHQRSVARFNQWHGAMGSTDPHLYAEVVNWLQRERQHAEEMARLAAIQRAQEAAAAEQRYQEERRAAEQRNQERERDLQMQRDKEARQRDRHEPGYRGHDYEGDRRRAEANEQARQEASRASGPTCVFCNQPGIASTASGWMCGLHAQGLL